MSTVDGLAAASSHTPTLGSLLRAELLRARSRRFVRWSVATFLALLVLIAVTQFFKSAKPTEAEIEAAKQACSAAAGGVTCALADAVKGGYLQSETGVGSELPELMRAAGLSVAILAFILGATLGGADWSQKTVAALLFWEPRRVRVFLVKLLAVWISVLVVFAVALAMWSLLVVVVTTVHGVWDDGGPPITSSLLTNLGRTALLTVITASVGFGIASLTRNTGAALGIAFVYLAILESVLHVLFDDVAAWLLTTNVGALVTEGGFSDGESGLRVSSARGAVVLVVYAVALCGIGLELFRRRDVT